MAREKYQTLTEQMFYILLCLRRPCCGTDIMEQVRRGTGGRVVIGPGTLYTLLDAFCRDGWIEEVRVEGRKRTYRITDLGQARLHRERERLGQLLADYAAWTGGEDG